MKIDVTVIAPATPQRNSQTTLPRQCPQPGGMRGAIRRPTGDGVLDPTREFLASASILCLDSLPGVSSSTPPLSSPGPSRIPPGRPQISSLLAYFGVQKRIQNFIRFLKAFGLPKWCQKPPKMMPKFIKNACFFQVCFHTVFSLILEGFLVAFPGARPLICMVISNEFVGCAFFRRVKKSNQNDLPKSSKMPPKMLPEAFKNLSKNEAKK